MYQTVFLVQTSTCTYPVIAGLALLEIIIDGHTASLNPLSKEFLAAFCKSKAAIIMASSATTHLAGSLHFFMDGRGVLAFLLNLEWGELGMLSQREELGGCLHGGSHSIM